MSLHDDYSRTTEERPGSDRNFGLVFFAFFGLLGVYLYRLGHPYHIFLLFLSLSFLVVSLTSPSYLNRPKLWWQKIGLLLSKLTNPIILAVLFYGVVCPLGIALQLCGKDILGRLRHRKRISYWITRTPPSTKKFSMKNQF